MPRTPRLKVSPLWTFRCKTPRPNLRTSLCLLRPPGGFLTLLCDENRYYPAYPKGRCGAASSRSSGSIMRRSWACRSSPGTQAFIAIGSNLGDRAANMRKALSALKVRGSHALDLHGPPLTSTQAIQTRSGLFVVNSSAIRIYSDDLARYYWYAGRRGSRAGIRLL